MSELDYNDLCQQASQWMFEASDLDFLGEIALTQEELTPFQRALGRFHKRLGERELSFVLAVTAVNWAYWRGADDESSGFRKSFMTDLLGHQDLRKWEDDWGPAIERAICGWSEQPRGAGAYRYVGLIYRHAGVPHVKIPQLAQLLKKIDDQFGWEHLRSVTNGDLEELVKSCFSIGCVRDHLKSEAGLGYLRSLSEDIMRLRSRRELSHDLPGYRPGLLAALLEHLGPGGARAPSAPVPLPYVSFESATGRIALVFDERLVRRQNAIECDQWPRALFDTRIDLGPGGLEPAPVYSGRLTGGGTWSTKGWRYTDSDAWALFRCADGRLVSTHSHDELVATGDYLLALTADVGIQSIWPEAEDDGERYLPDDTECRLWHVTLREGDEGKLPGLRITTSAQPWLECVNVGELTRWTTYDAVCSDAPRFLINGWTARTSRRFRLTLTTPQGTQDLNPPLSVAGTASIVLSDLAIGVEADISLTQVGYHQGPRFTQTLRVVRFPGSLEMEQSLWSPAQSVTLRGVVRGGIKLSGEEGARVDLKDGRVSVSVESGAKWASVSAITTGASLPLQLPVRRCSFCASENPGVPVLFDRLLLKQMCEATFPLNSLTISAIPGATVDILVRDYWGVQRVWRRGLRMGSNGRAEVPATEFVDVARNERGILEIFILVDGRAVPTESMFVDPTVSDLDTGPWTPLVTQYLKLLRQPLEDLKALDLLAQAPCLYRHAVLVMQADYALELSPIAPRLGTVTTTSSWISKVQRLLNATPQSPGPEVALWKASLRACMDAAPVPLCPTRWDAAIRSRVADVDRRVDVSGPLVHLLSGERDPAVPDALSNGWTCYVNAQVGGPSADEQLIRANSYFAAFAHGTQPWDAIAKRLSAWTLLRAGAFKAFCKCVSEISPSEYARGLTSMLNVVASLLALEQPGEINTMQDGLGQSCREDDRLLAAAIAGEPDGWAHAADKCWLAAWLAWRRSVIMNLDRTVRESCRRVAETYLDTLQGRAFDILSDEIRSGAPRSIKADMEFA